MLEEYTSNLCSLIENKDIRSLTCNALFESLTECFPLNIIVKSMIAVKNLQLTISDTIFMNKMNKFLTNAFTDYNMQVKFSGLFEDEQKRKDAVKKVIQVIEKIDFDEKVDIFANLTRAVCMEMIDTKLYLRFAASICNLLYDDLYELKSLYNKKDVEETSTLSNLYMYRMVTKQTVTTLGSTVNKYNISNDGIEMLRCGLDIENYDKYK